jgi:hypothetical protein
MLPRPQWSPRISGLDEVVRRFQDRWETDRQFRAMLSGALGLVMVVALCACMGVVTTVANSALAGVNGNGSGSQNSNTGTGKVNVPPSFPTTTVPPWQQSGPPAYTIIPNSQTPQPAPTHPPTATPDNQGGGGGGIPTTCDGAGSHATWALVPCPQVHGQSGTLNLSVPRHPGAALNILINFGCNGCTVLYPPTQGYKLDATGNASISYTVPAAAANSTMPISGYINVAGGPTLTINAAPVQ